MKRVEASSRKELKPAAASDRSVRGGSPTAAHQLDSSVRAVAQRQLMQRIFGASGAACVQRMGWTWDGTGWNANDPQTTLAPPDHKGKYAGEYFDDGHIESEPLDGYELLETTTHLQAHVANPNGHVFGKVALEHLVEAANGFEQRVHRSKKMEGHSSDTYVHPNDDELYTFTLDGSHSDGVPKITVQEQGKVRDGVHKFK